MRLSALVHVQDAERGEESRGLRRTVPSRRAVGGRTTLPRFGSERSGFQPGLQEVHLQGVQGEGAEPGSGPERRYERHAGGAGRGRGEGSGGRQPERSGLRGGYCRGQRGAEAGYVERLYRGLREGLFAPVERPSHCGDLREPGPPGHYARKLGCRCGEGAQAGDRRGYRRFVQRFAQPYRPLRRDAAQHHAASELAPHSGGAAGREGAAARA